MSFKAPFEGSPIIFRDRMQAAESLSKELAAHSTDHPLVLGIPRGSIPMAKFISDRLHGDLDVILVHKLGAPDNPEFAIGSVSEFGTVYISEAVKWYPNSSHYIENEIREQLVHLKSRRDSYSPIRAPISPKGRTVIIVDDGIATGATMVSAVRAIRSQNPHKIIVAAPVASTSAVDMIKNEVDHLVILQTPENFFSISEFYVNFSQVTDEEVIQVLNEANLNSKAA